MPLPSRLPTLVSCNGSAVVPPGVTFTDAPRSLTARSGPSPTVTPTPSSPVCSPVPLAAVTVKETRPLCPSVAAARARTPTENSPPPPTVSPTAQDSWRWSVLVYVQPFGRSSSAKPLNWEPSTPTFTPRSGLPVWS